MEFFLLFSSLWNLKFLCTLHRNNKIFLLRFYCIWNSGNWKFASLHKLVFYTLLLHVKLKNQIACVSFLFLPSFSFRFTDNLFFSFIPYYKRAACIKENVHKIFRKKPSPYLQNANIIICINVIIRCINYRYLYTKDSARTEKNELRWQ